MGRPPQCDSCCPVTTSTTTTGGPTTTTTFIPTTTEEPTTTPEPCVNKGFNTCRYEYNGSIWSSVWAFVSPECFCGCPSSQSIRNEWNSQNVGDPATGQCADAFVPCCPSCYDYTVNFNAVCPTTTTTTEGPTTTTTTTGGPTTTTTTPSPYAVVYCRSTCDEDTQNACFGGTFDLPVSFSPSDCQDFVSLSDASKFYNDLLTSTRAVMIPGSCNDSFAITMINSLCSNCPDEPCTTTTTSPPTTTTTTAAPTTTTTSSPTTTTTEGPTTTTTSGPTTTTTSGPTLPPTTTTTTTIKPFACVICPADAPICVPVDDCSECEAYGNAPCITNCNLDELPSDFSCWGTSPPDDEGDEGDGDPPDPDPI